MAGDTTTPARRWYVSQWPPLAWVETVIKLLAHLMGIIALVGALSAGNFVFPGGARLAQAIILALVSIVLVTVVIDRFNEGEIISIAFALTNNLGHWGMLVALFSQPGPGWLLVAFATLMLAGDLVKLLFLAVHGFKARTRPRAFTIGITIMFALAYALLLLLELLR